MNYLRKFGLMALALAFLMCLTAVSSDAQWRRDRDRRDRGGLWQQRNDDRRWRNRDYRNRRLTANEYRRLQRQRYRLYRTRERYYRNDGYISDRERRRLQKRYNKYRRNVYRDRRDW